MIYSDIQNIAILLKEKIGLEPTSIGIEAIARTVNQCMGEAGINNISNYLHILQDSPQQWQALIDNIVIPETWFFRERESFKFLQKYITSEWLPNHPHGLLKILTVPCSTGEEPYSIAIALLELGLNGNNFHIDAVDISQKSLISARQGIYSSYSFRGNTLSFQEKYFIDTPRGYHLHEHIKNLVNFQLGNLAQGDFFSGKPPYDIIFCRNLLIYFDVTTKERTIRLLHRLLVPEGLLFVGHAEAGLLLHSSFISVKHSLAFAYRKGNSSHNSHNSHTSYRQLLPPLKPHLSHGRSQQQSSVKTRRLPANIPANSNYIPQPKNHLETKLEQLLNSAKILADHGDLPGAIEKCRQYLSKNKVNVEAYILMGEIQQAMNQEQQAIESFQKAVYLEPNHYQALTHLALLIEHQGDKETANLLWKRIQRLDSKIGD